MKPKLYLLLLAPILLLSACTKWFPSPQENIIGSWKLQSVERQTSYGSEHIYTGYEGGVFYFNNNGNAQYSDSYGQMNGTWRLISRPGDGTNALQLRVYDYYKGDAIEWEFYSINTSGTRMIGYMNKYGYEYRYEFRRY
jgi:hypothetical protein